MESAAEQVSPTGESVAQLLARIERQAALISEGRVREAAKDAVIAALQARAEAQDPLCQRSRPWTSWCPN